MITILESCGEYEYVARDDEQGGVGTVARA
jgi:hypothetical protein